MEKTRWRGVARGLLLAAFVTSILVNASAFKEFYFSTEPSDVVALKDSPVTLNCSVKGNPPPTIEWKREGAILQFIGDTRRSILPNGSLYISSVFHTKTDRPDEGVYQCVASLKSVGTIVSRTAKLQVASLPRFDEQPQDLMVYPGQVAYFSCSIQGIPPASIKWLKDDHPLNQDPSRMAVFPSGALQIDRVETSDSGRYRCNASNMEKHRLSSYGVLTVTLDYAEANRISPPQFISTPRSARVIEGSSVTLDCVANGNPRPRITWLKDGSTIDVHTADNQFQTMGVGSLQIKNIQEGDEGVYMCRAENHVDSVDASATVEVQVPPQFVKRPENKYAYEKDDVEFECEIYGKPEATVQWVKNGDIIIQSEYFQIVSGYNLRILGLVRSDAGIYQCIGANPAGNIQAAAQLILLEPGDQAHRKDVPSAPQDVTAVIVSTRFVTLSWSQPIRTSGDIFAYSVYYREESSARERVLNTTRPRLEEVSIQGLQPSTSYLFRVVGYNQHGPGESSENIMIETQAEVHVPGSPHNLRALATSPTSVHVQWHAPDQQNGPIQQYKLYYMVEGTSEEHEVTTADTSYTVQDLRKFVDYVFWVVAYNQNGAGLSTEEVTARTFSDTPSETPQNVTLEAASSTSIIVRWEPPPKESQNGIITGYKIRYKLKGSRGDTVTTDGNRRLYTLTGLERGSQYSIKIAALTINGTGPSTDWMTVDTYHNDLDESTVPDQPSSLRARPTANAIFVSWTPPRNQNIMIRGYTIGWGIGFPDVYTKVLDGKQRYYTIENLQPSYEYVISLRAFNQVGDGRPIYETVKTLIETTPKPLTPLLPPMGVKAIVLSATTVVLYWTDTTLPRSQLVTDSRYYTVRYAAYSHTSSSKHRYFNSTDLNCMIDDLKPNNQYEFSVKVVKGKRESTWSMSVINTTQEAAPSSPPRDVTVVPIEDDTTAINLHWQPPKQPNGQITGYIIFYTTDNTQKDRDWVVEDVIGDRVTATVESLAADTTYFFKVQPRNNKGYGPLSSEVSYHTAPNGKGLMNNMLYIVIACVSGGTILIITVVSIVICRRRKQQEYLSQMPKIRYGMARGGGKELKPPDLWIHHDQMELKAIEKSRSAGSTMTVTPIPRSAHESGEDDLMDMNDKKKGTYVTIAATTPIPNGSMGHTYEGGSSSLPRPVYPRTQYNTPHSHIAVDSCPGSSSNLSSPQSSSHHPYEQVTSPTLHINLGGSATMGTAQHPSYNTNVNPGEGGGTLGKQSAAHPLKSFIVPAPPSQSAPTTPQRTHIAVRPQQISSPQKKAPGTSSGASSQQSTLRSKPGTIPRPNDSASKLNREENFALSYSTEELNQEMANLEGLMKDLNAITASEFEYQ